MITLLGGGYHAGLNASRTGLQFTPTRTRGLAQVCGCSGWSLVLGAVAVVVRSQTSRSRRSNRSRALPHGSNGHRHSNGHRDGDAEPRKRSHIDGNADGHGHRDSYSDCDSYGDRNRNGHGDGNSAAARWRQRPAW